MEMVVQLLAPLKTVGLVGLDFLLYLMYVPTPAQLPKEIMEFSHARMEI